MPNSSSNNQDQDPLSKESFGLWKIHPVTVEIYRELNETRAQLSRALGSGQTLTGSAGDTAEKTAEMVGLIKGIDLLLNITYDDEEGADDDD